MKKSDEFIPLNDEYDDNAQAVSQSELLPIYEAMSFSGDIQPLDDIVEAEKTTIDFDGKKSENKSTEKKSSIKKKKSSAKAGSRIKTFIACVVLVIVVIGGMAGAYFWVQKDDINSSPVAAIYKTNDKNTMLKLADGTEYNIGEASEISVSTDGMYVWLTRNTSSTTGKYDLRMIDVASKKSLKKQGKFVEKGIDDGWKTTVDGQFVCYGITNSNTTSCYMYSVEMQKTVTVAESVEEYFPSSVDNMVYFTRRNGSVYSLHREKFGENSENVASGIDYVKYSSGSDGYEVIYTKATGTGTDVNIYSVKNQEEPVCICENVSEVYLNDYVYNGNLYYFTKNESNVNWQDFVTDDYYETDLQMQKPVESDYMVEKGFIFKRKVLDTTKYNAAYHQYKLKEIRDEIRDELDNLDLGLSMKNEYTCFAYNNGVSRRIATGVTLDNVVEFSKDGAPRLIYRKSAIKVENELTMDKLVEIANQTNVQKAMDYVRNVVGGSYQVSDSCFFSWFNGNKVNEYEINGFDADKTEFVFSDGGEIYAVTNSELYFTQPENSAMSKKRLIDSDVSDCVAVSDAMYYEKTDAAGAKSLYKFIPSSGKKEICKNLYSYFAVSDSFAIVLTRQSNSDELMSVGIYDGNGYAVVDSDLNLNNFIYSEKSFAYIKNYKSGSGELYSYSSENGAVKCGDGVTEILYIY